MSIADSKQTVTPSVTNYGEMTVQNVTILTSIPFKGWDELVFDMKCDHCRKELIKLLMLASWEPSCEATTLPDENGCVK